MARLIIYTDGGARGNPGPAACGVVINGENGELLFETSKYIGIATNNQAEYEALILALEKAKEIFDQNKAETRNVECNLDSELVVKQLKREYKIKNEGLKPLFSSAVDLACGFDSVTFMHIPREKNKLADKLVNRELDKAERNNRS